MELLIAQKLTSFREIYLPVCKYSFSKYGKGLVQLALSVSKAETVPTAE